MRVSSGHCYLKAVTVSSGDREQRSVKPILEEEVEASETNRSESNVPTFI